MTAHQYSSEANEHIAPLEKREAQLVAMLERCVPPVDQHRHDLQLVRVRLADLRAGPPKH